MKLLLESLGVLIGCLTVPLEASPSPSLPSLPAFALSPSSRHFDAPARPLRTLQQPRARWSMKFEKASELRKMSTPELEQALVTAQKEAAMVRFKQTGRNKEWKPHQLKHVKRKIAQLYTILYERHMDTPRDDPGRLIGAAAEKEAAQ
ncbi:unnamed protein product [Vitrella brassicaformis CCMP3155]|uniref:Large ribosomal subunit protein uL29c n=2 Tax=Vitrella brassicaformis TaxID=1169539 RepID=A0A0G4ENI4_VITBC|nr:unnamed protein product [Vitrella brassicaformis CCMP3155]|mmetsp:Transcript_17784/g.42739  ORF Transcript_17784/g.42739 Transcript_17784/m.42739 type:complete len:148 (+) Transcript_17784:109-552(+)|eukprot:CEL99418.1 unnamed protein product [Vitrella brassicaformis CCMP3155]